MANTEPILYTEVEQRAHAIALFESAGVLLTKAEKYGEIVGDADAALIGELRAHLNQSANDLDNERLDMTKGLRETTQKINTRFNAKIDALRVQVDRIDGLLKGFLARKRREREDAERRAREEAAAQARREEDARRAAAEAQAKADAAAAAGDKAAEEAAVAAMRAAEAVVQDAMVAVPTVIVPPPVTGIAGAYGSKLSAPPTWKYRVVDITKVPEEFLLPPDERVAKAVLNALARSQKDKAKVAGIEFYPEENISSRVAR